MNCGNGIVLMALLFRGFRDSVVFNKRPQTVSVPGFFARTTLLRKIFLIAAAYRVETERAVLWFDRGSMSSEARVAFGSQVNRGNRRSGEIPRHYRRAGPFRRLNKIPYFVNKPRWAFRRRFLGRAGSIPETRVGERRLCSSYVHETAHYLLRCKTPRGLSECPPQPTTPAHRPSQASPATSRTGVFERFGGRPSRVFTKGSNAGVDGEALAFLPTEAGNGVLPFVGTEGMPPNLLTDRVNVAPPFYGLLQSFCKYLTGKIGLDKMKALHAAQWNGPAQARMESLTGAPAAAWVKRWLVSIGYRDVLD